MRLPFPWAKTLIKQYISPQEFEEICSGLGLDQEDRKIALQMLEHWHPNYDWDDLTNLAERFANYRHIMSVAEAVVTLATKAAENSANE